MDTIYKEHANGRWEYWTYSDGRKYAVSGVWAEKQAMRGTAKIILVR
jgi:hypothetical protein